MSMNQQKRKDQALRLRVSDNVLSLLRRAEGLELLDYQVGVTEVSDDRAFNQQLGPDDTFVGYDMDEDGVFKKVLVTEDLLYPVAGYPECTHLLYPEDDYLG